MLTDAERGESAELLAQDTPTTVCLCSALKSLGILSSCLLVFGAMTYRLDTFGTAYLIAVGALVPMGAFWCYGRAGVWDSSAETMLQWQPMFVCFIYVGLFVTFTFLTKAIQDDGPAVSVIVLVSLVAKVLISIIAWRVHDGSFGDMIYVMRLSSRFLVEYAFIAALYALSDLLRMTFVQEASPSAFHVLINFRVLMLVVAWEAVMGMRLCWHHWIAIFAICTGCFVKELSHGLESGGLESMPYVAYIHMAIIILLTTVGLVLNEKVLKNVDSPPLNLQNLILAAFGIVFMALHSIATAANLGVAQTPAFQLNQYALFSKPLVLSHVVVFTLLGLMTSVVLKQFSNVVKEAAKGVEMLVSVPLDVVIFGRGFYFVEIVGCMSVLFGVSIFALFPIGKKATTSTARWTTRVAAFCEKCGIPLSQSVKHCEACQAADQRNVKAEQSEDEPRNDKTTHSEGSGSQAVRGSKFGVGG